MVSGKYVDVSVWCKVVVSVVSGHMLVYLC